MPISRLLHFGNIPTEQNDSREGCVYLKEVVTLGGQWDGRTGVVAVVLFSFDGRVIALTVPNTLLGPHLWNRNTDQPCSVLTL